MKRLRSPIDLLSFFPQAVNFPSGWFTVGWQCPLWRLQSFMDVESSCDFICLFICLHLLSARPVTWSPRSLNHSVDFRILFARSPKFWKSCQFDYYKAPLASSGVTQCDGRHVSLWSCEFVRPDDADCRVSVRHWEETVGGPNDRITRGNRGVEDQLGRTRPIGGPVIIGLRVATEELQYNLEITVLNGPANFDLYWRELVLVGDHYSMIFSQFSQKNNLYQYVPQKEQYSITSR